MACFADVLYQVLTSKNVDHILANQSCLSKLFADYEVIRRASQKTVVGIYKVMYGAL